MENEMVERVARALQLHEWGGDHNPEPPPHFWGETRAFWVGVARVAIEAMQQPTEAMDLAGVEAESYRSLGLLKVRHIWRAMIDAALQKTPQTAEADPG